MIGNSKKIIYFLFVALCAGVLVFFSFQEAQAQTCPSRTTVEGTTVTFVGELTDTGGDEVNFVWFEYGKTNSLGQKTSEKTLTEPGVYCISVSGLSQNTTYFYRAVARNSAGTSFGEIKSFTTSASFTQPVAEFTFSKTVKNISDNTDFLKSVSANPGEALTFRIRVKAGSSPVSNIVVVDTLPAKLIFKGDLRVDNILVSGDIFSGLNIGDLAAFQEKTITFRADVAGAEKFSFGKTSLINTASGASSQFSKTDTATVLVTKDAPVSGVTAIPTGFAGNVLIDYFFLPLAIAGIFLFIFKGRFAALEQWFDEYKSKKILRLKIFKIKQKENI